jgi:hypothetical protein
MELPAVHAPAVAAHAVWELEAADRGVEERDLITVDYEVAVRKPRRNPVVRVEMTKRRPWSGLSETSFHVPWSSIGAGSPVGAPLRAIVVGAAAGLVAPESPPHPAWTEATTTLATAMAMRQPLQPTAFMIEGADALAYTTFVVSCARWLGSPGRITV